MRVLTSSTTASDESDVLADSCTHENVSITTLRMGPWKWRVLTEWLEILKQFGTLDWAHLDRDPSAHRVKRNSQREVWRLTRGGHAVYAKIYHGSEWWGRVKQLRYGPPGAAEWRAGMYARQQNIPAIVPMACGFRVRNAHGARCVLLTLELSKAVPAEEFWRSLSAISGRSRLRQARSFVVEAANHLALAHRQAFLHHDLHAANLLVQTESDDSVRVAFVDLHGARIGAKVTEADARKNLVQLNQWFSRHASRTDRLRFLRAYLAHWASEKDAPAPSRAVIMRWINTVESASRRHAAGLWAKRDRRVTRDGSYFTRLRLSGGWSGHATLSCKRPITDSRASRLTFTPDQWRAWLEKPSRFFTPDRPELILKDSHSGMVCRAHLPVEGQPLEIIAKRARPRNWIKRLWYLFRPARAIQTFRRGHALLHRELPTARPLVAVQRRIGGIVVDSLVITEALSDPEDLDALLRIRLLGEAPSVRRQVKRQLIDELVSLFVNMHERGCLHRDMKAPNILVQWSGSRGDTPRVTLVDLDGLRVRRRPLSWPERMQMIMRLNVSLAPCRVVTITDRLRFLKAYLRRHSHPTPNWRTLWRDLTAASERKHRQKAKRHVWKLKHYGRG